MDISCSRARVIVKILIQRLYSLGVLINASASSCECQLQQVMVGFHSLAFLSLSPLPPLLSSPPSVLLSLLASSVFCQCCVMPLLSSSVFQLHRSAAGLLRECVWGREVCVCVCARVSACTHTCVSVLQSSVAMATSGTWLRQLCGPALPELGCRRPLSLSSGEMHTHTHTFLHVTQRQTDRLTDRLCLTQAQ